MASTFSARSNIKFSVKKILYENETQRRESVKKKVELKKEEMEKAQKELQVQLSQILQQTTIQREREIAEKLANLEALEEQFEHQLEIERKNEVQRKKFQESEEVLKRIIPFQQNLHAKWTDIANILSACQDKNAAYSMLTRYSSELKKLSDHMENINEKAKVGDLTVSDVSMAENIAHISHDIYLKFKDDVDEIDALCERETAEREKNLIEASLAAQHEAQRIEQLQDLKNQELNNTVQMQNDMSIQQATIVQPDTQQNVDNHVLVQQPTTISGNLNGNAVNVSGNASTSTLTKVHSESKANEASESSAKLFAQSHQFLNDYSLSFQEFSQNNSTKKFKFECQKTLNLAINAVSHNSQEQLVEKYNKIKNFLTGRGTPNISANPQALNYSKYLLAQKIVEQGDTSISSKPELAFPFAAIAVALWNDWPDFGELILAFFRTKCPFFIPILPKTQPGQSEDDYVKLIGWKSTESGFEKPEQYWKRIGGMMYLYASIIVTKQRKNLNKPHPHGIAFAWRWLAATMNIEPTCETADIFATLIFTMLEVTGNDLLKTYPNQFPKMLLALKTVYCRKLNSFDSVAKAPMTRLAGFLDLAVKNSGIPPPKGQLPPGFW